MLSYARFTLAAGTAVVAQKSKRRVRLRVSLTVHLHVVVDALAAQEGLHQLNLLIEEIRRLFREERARAGIIQRAAAVRLHVSTFDAHAYGAGAVEAAPPKRRERDTRIDAH